MEADRVAFSPLLISSFSLLDFLLGLAFVFVLLSFLNARAVAGFWKNCASIVSIPEVRRLSWSPVGPISDRKTSVTLEPARDPSTEDPSFPLPLEKGVLVAPANSSPPSIVEFAVAVAVVDAETYAAEVISRGLTASASHMIL